MTEYLHRFLSLIPSWQKCPHSLTWTNVVLFLLNPSEQIFPLKPPASSHAGSRHWHLLIPGTARGRFLTSGTEVCLLHNIAGEVGNDRSWRRTPVSSLQQVKLGRIPVSLQIIINFSLPVSVPVLISDLSHLSSTCFTSVDQNKPHKTWRLSYSPSFSHHPSCNQSCNWSWQ